jgi:hypothetical protein
MTFRTRERAVSPNETEQRCPFSHRWCAACDQPAGRKVFRSCCSAHHVTQVIGVMGSQWGDEGKGKLVDVLGDTYDITARCAGGANAG